MVRAAAAIGAVGLLASVGLAASLGSSSKALGAGNVLISRCDSDGVTVTQNLSGSNVVSVTVGGIAASCAGGSLSVTVDNATASSSGSATVPGGGGSMTVALAAAVAEKDADQVDLAISGP